MRKSSGISASAALAAAILASSPGMLRAQYDTTSPSLTSFGFAPQSINTDAAPQNVTFTAGFTDDLSGIQSIWVSLQSPPTGQNTSQTQNVGMSPQTPITSPALSGVLTGNLKWPQHSQIGVWTVASVCLYDNVGNYRCYYTPELTTLGFPTALTVTTQNPDTTPPILTGLSITQSAINVSTAPAAFTVDISATDDQTTVYPSCWLEYSEPFPQVHLTPVYQSQGCNYTQQISGSTPLSGTWRSTITIPRYSVAGTWTFHIRLDDAAGNSVTPDLSSRPHSVTVASSPTDVTSAQITAFTFAPSVIDTTLQPQMVTFTVAANDGLSGLFRYNSIAWGCIQFMSPLLSDNQRQYRSGCLSSFGSGSNLNGFWQGSVSFPRYSAGGTWEVANLWIYDFVGNATSLYYGSPDLAKLGPTQLVNLAPAQGPNPGGFAGVVGPTGGTVPDPAGSGAQVTFPPNELQTDSFVYINVYPNPPSFVSQLPRGVSAPGTQYVDLHLSPEPSLPLPAPGVTLTLPLALQLTPGFQLQLYRKDPATGYLVPSVDANGNTILGTVDASGKTATFTGVIWLSIEVGMIPSALTAGDANGDGKIDCTDVAMVKAAMGKKSGQPGYSQSVDVNMDGVVNVYDLAFTLRKLPAGLTCPAK